MNFESMSLDELKSVAKDKGIRAGNISKEKLIEKLLEAENISNVASVVDDDLSADIKTEIEDDDTDSKPKSILESITSAIDELDEGEDEYIEDSFVELPRDTVINVRSITFGQLIYKSPTNNARFIWNNIGSVIQMTIAELTEMNNQKPEFLTNPNIILLNEDAIRQFRLNSVYENVAQVNNLKSLFKKDEATIERAIDKALLANMRNVLISKIRIMYDNKALTDINVIKLLERKLQFDLTKD